MLRSRGPGTDGRSSVPVARRDVVDGAAQETDHGALLRAVLPVEDGADAGPGRGGPADDDRALLPRAALLGRLDGRAPTVRRLRGAVGRVGRGANRGRARTA